MSESIDNWVERLSSCALPALRQTLTEVKDLLNHSHASLTRLSEMVEFDPGFSLYLFRYLNDLPKRPREPISKISNVIASLGVIALERAITDLPVLTERIPVNTRIGLTTCYSRAAHASVYAAGLAKWRGQHDTQAFITAALLHDIGEMTLWVQAPDVMRGIERLVHQGAGRKDAALEVLGFTLEALNQQLSLRWQLSGLTQDSQGLFNSHQPDPLTVMLACEIARASALDWHNRELTDGLELLAGFLDISEDAAQALIHQLAAQAGRKLYRLPLPLSVRRLIPIPSRTEASVKPENANQAQPASQTARPESSASGPTSSIPAHAKVANKSGNQTGSLHAQLTETIDEMRHVHGLNNVMFAMLSPDRRWLKARFVASTSESERLRGFEAKLDGPGLFSVMMQKTQALWFNAGNRERYRPMIPPQTIRALNDNGFLMMSIFLRNKPIGLFYADKAEAASGLTADQFHNFKLSCQRFAQHLGRFEQTVAKPR
jgi:hypothetical protein